MKTPAPSRRPAALIAAIAAAWLAAPTLAAQESSWFLGGTVTARGLSAYSEGLGGAGGWSWGSSTGLSAGLGVRGPSTRAEASFAAAALTGSAAAAARALAQAADAGLLAPGDPARQTLVLGSDEAAFSLRLRSLWAKLDLGWASLQAGRQVLNYGRAPLWSPVDLFASLDLSGTSPERLGTDALRLKVPLGDLSGLDLVASPAADPAEGRYAIRLAGAAFGLDAGLLGAWDGGSGLLRLGGDCKFDLGAGFWAEGLLSLDPGAPEPLATAVDRSAAGFDWSWEDFVFAAEYYHNGAGGAGDPAFPSAHYLFASLGWSAGDYLRLALSATVDLLEGPFRGQASVFLDASQNGSLAAWIDWMEGSFAAASTGNSTLGLGASLAVKF